jgi:hypothetical protein
LDFGRLVYCWALWAKWGFHLFAPWHMVNFGFGPQKMCGFLPSGGKKAKTSFWIVGD